jgi:hypothetical protein
MGVLWRGSGEVLDAGVREFGPGFADVPLHAHSHVIDTELDESRTKGGQAGWWEVQLVGVSDPSVWNQIVAGKR